MAGESTPWRVRYVEHQEPCLGSPADMTQACFGAMLFGVETGIIGGVLTMEPFQKDYGLWEKEDVAKANLEANIGMAKRTPNHINSTTLTLPSQ